MRAGQEYFEKCLHFNERNLLWLQLHIVGTWLHIVMCTAIPQQLGMLHQNAPEEYLCLSFECGIKINPSLCYITETVCWVQHANVQTKTLGSRQNDCNDTADMMEHVALRKHVMQFIVLNFCPWQHISCQSKQNSVPEVWKKYALLSKYISKVIILRIFPITPVSPFGWFLQKIEFIR